MVVPAMREVPASSNRQVFEFADSLMHSGFDLVIFLSGAGVRTMLNVVETKYDREVFLSALRSVKVACRLLDEKHSKKTLSLVPRSDVAASTTLPSKGASVIWHQLTNINTSHFPMKEKVTQSGHTSSYSPEVARFFFLSFAVSACSTAVVSLKKPAIAPSSAVV